MNRRLGSPVIDELRLCYLAEPLLLVELSSVEVGGNTIIEPFKLYRVGGDRFEYAFSVCAEIEDRWVEVAMLKFNRYGSLENQYVYYAVSNHVLYKPTLLQQVLTFPGEEGMRFNNYTAIDIAIDYPKNISSIIKRMMRNDQIKTILNGKKLVDRSKIIQGVTCDYATSLNKFRYLTITLRQAKATKNRERGVTVQSYDKYAEVLTSSGKDYILDYYQHPSRLYRLEVRLHYQELQDYCRRIGVTQSVELLLDPEFLAGAFYYHLASVLRFTKGRRKLAWQEIIDSNGKV